MDGEVRDRLRARRCHVVGGRLGDGEVSGIGAEPKTPAVVANHTENVREAGKTRFELSNIAYAAVE